ncbi:uncharacterized protein RJT21DRAFT_120936 [Scheffersomyces amazonensis]|uniref:uncharacterized protein n=1 Tax=Scheffersomyces amazonensis TaxID=1078765 RepID=UPI00315CA5A3
MMRVIPRLSRSRVCLGNHQAIRCFSQTSLLLKDEKSKQVLKSLGLSLQKGNLKPSEESSESEANAQDHEQQKEAIEQSSASSSSQQQNHTETVSQTTTSEASSPLTTTTASSPTSTTTSTTTTTTNTTNIDPLPTNSNDETNEHSVSRTPSLFNSSKTEPYNDTNNSAEDLMNQAYDTISHMSADDVIIQVNFDGGRSLFSFDSEHYLNRKEIIRSLPEEIDLFNPEDMKRIDEIYDKLHALDTDKTVQAKYYKRYLRKYNDPIVNLLQEFNGISKKFKLLRRKEIDSLHLSPGAYVYHENLFKSPYNVVGFDRSISGLPLRSGKHELTERCYPQEFIEDLQMYRDKVPIQKRDLDFIELDDESTNIDPKTTTKFNQNKHTNQDDKSFKSKAEKIDQLLDGFTDTFDKPFILIPKVDNYETLDLRNDITKRVESEILLLKKTLQIEIENFFKSNLNSRLFLGNQPLKSNQFRLCDADSHRSKNNSQLYIINYSFKDFPMIPNYSIVLNSRKQRNQLRNHLYKLFLINLEDQIDTLFKIKYLDESAMKKFMDKMLNTIGNIICIRLLKLFKPISPVFDDHNALIYSPYLNNSLSFKRLYFLDDRRKPLKIKSNRNNRNDSKKALRIDYKPFDNLIEY